jgi:nucleotide-binding universal stress UspA family protein
MRAVEKAKELGKAFDSNIVLVTVTEFIHHNYEYATRYLDEIKEIEESKKQSEAILEKNKARLRELGDKVETVMLEGDPAYSLIQYIKSSDADLVIIGSHGVKGLRQFMLGSVVSKIVHHVDKSVMIVR